MQPVRILAIAACVTFVSAGVLAVTLLVGNARSSTIALMVILLVLGSALVSGAVVLRSRENEGGVPGQR